VENAMADAITAAIGAIIMCSYIWMIAFKLDELPLWIACLIGIALMLWAFWIDAWRPIFKRDSNSR
jgi:putative flippase GtrA